MMGSWVRTPEGSQRQPKSSKNKDDSLAQLVEHITFNDGVLGSNPRGITKDNQSLQKNKDDSLAQLVEHITFNDGVLGSNPRGITKDNQSLQKIRMIP